MSSPATNDKCKTRRLLPVGLCTVGPCERKCGTHFPWLLRRFAVRDCTELVTVADVLCMCRLAAAGSWVDHALKRPGSRVLVSTLIAPRSPLLAQAAWRCAHWVCFADSCFATTRFASSRCFATRLLRRSGAARQCQFLTLLSHSPSLLSFREMHYGAVSVGSTRVRHPYYSGAQYSTLERSVLASGISAGFDAALGHYPFTPTLLRANVLWWPVGLYGEMVQVDRASCCGRERNTSFRVLVVGKNIFSSSPVGAGESTPICCRC